MDKIKIAKVYVRIVELGSMVSAADSLDISPPMVSRYLQQMENWVGARLLHRSTRRISLTDMGEKVFLQCKELLEMAGQISKTKAILISDPTGSVRITCANSFAQFIMIGFLDLFHSKYPGIHVDIHVGNKAVNLIKERVDLAIRITNDLDPNVIAKPLGKVRSVLCASPDYLKNNKTPVKLNELSNHNCLTYTYFGEKKWSFKNGDKYEDVPVKGNFSSNEPLLILSATLNGSGISLQPKHAVSKYLEDKQLEALLTDFEVKELGLYGVYQSRNHQSQAFKLLMNELQVYLEERDI